MITTILLVIGFLITGGAFGAQVIGAFSLAQYWLWFIAILASMFALVIIAGLTFLGGTKANDEKFGKLATLLAGGAAGFIGTLISIFVVASSYFMLWLSYFITYNTPLNATSWSELPTDVTYAIIGFFIVMVLSIFKWSSSKGSK